MMADSTNLTQLISDTQRSGNWDALIELVPYAGFIGIIAQSMGDEILFRMEPLESNTGNPLLPALHGGVIAGFMETAATLNLMMRQGLDQVPKVVDFTVDYLRTGKPQATFATCVLNRQGRRVANVEICAWQKNRETPIATARAHLLMDES